MTGFRVQVGVTAGGPPLGEVVWWDLQAMTALCEWARGAVRMRVGEGMGADGQPFKPYSTKRLYVELGGETARRLAPKGGRPSRTGKSVIFDGGYAEYKHLSRRRDKLAGSAEVDLVLSGQMLREVQTKDVTAEHGIVGVTGQSALYAYKVDAIRPFLAIADAEIPEMDDEIEGLVNEAVARAGSGRGGPPTAPVL